MPVEDHRTPEREEAEGLVRATENIQQQHLQTNLQMIHGITMKYEDVKKRLDTTIEKQEALFKRIMPLVDRQIDTIREVQQIIRRLESNSLQETLEAKVEEELKTEETETQEKIEEEMKTEETETNGQTETEETIEEEMKTTETNEQTETEEKIEEEEDEEELNISSF